MFQRVSASKEVIAVNPVTSTAPCDPAKTGTTLNYLTTTQVADLLSVDRSTISRWAATDPTMPVVRVHGVVRFERRALEAWLVGHQQGARRTQRRARAS
jgi:excisionase family DNA binding protein